MSASESSSPGGQPSTTQPIAGPWLSPKVVTQKSVPSVLPDIRAAGPSQFADDDGCSSRLSTGQSRMYAFSIRFSKSWLSTTALATS